MRKRAVSLILCLCMVLSLVPVPVLAQNVESNNPFADVEESDWFYDGVQYVFEHELMKGTSSTIFETLFEPERATQRGMIVTILYRLDGSPLVADTCPFEDVPRGSNYENAIIWAEKNGIVTGYTNTFFGPYDDITRQQMAAILYRYANVRHYDVTKQANLNVFTDSGRISSYARIPLSWANAEGLINGITPIVLAPTEKVTRAQSAVILTRFCENIVEGSVIPPTATYTVTFDLNYTGAGTNQTVSVEQGKTVSEPDAPKRSGYKFMGWYTATNAQKGTLFDFNTVINEDITLYARWTPHSTSSNHSSNGNGTHTNITTYYTVTFNTNNGNVIQPQSVASGNVAVRPTDPIREGYVFGGWYSDSGLNNPYNFTYAVTQNITLYAKWEQTGPITYKVSFDLNYEGAANNIPEQELNPGDMIEIPDDPERSGYIFAGWSTTHDLTDMFTGYDTGIDRNYTLYAYWVDNDDLVDADGDGLENYLESAYGTNKDNKDTDGDGLTDYQEIMELGTNPLAVDTDNNGVSDFDEDYDEDGITNGNEYAIGTIPVLSDSDIDGLSDYEEVNVYHTDPMKRDTDGDGASDGIEIQRGTNPLVPDSSFTETVEGTPISVYNPVSASVTANISGSQVGTVQVKNVQTIDNPFITSTIPGYLGDGYELSAAGEINSAVVTFSYDTNLGTLGDEFQPRIYYFDPDTQELVELPDQAVNDGVVTANISHFSTYILLNKVKFDAFWETEIKTPLSESDHDDATLSFIFVIDYSKSMSWNDPNQVCKNLSKQFIEKLREGKDEAAVVKFIRRATLATKLTTDKSVLMNAIDSISYDNGNGAYSGTNGSAGLKVALDEFASSDSEYKYIVFITDGEDGEYEGETYSYDDLISIARDLGVTIFSVGMSTASTDILEKVANSTGGKFYYATTEAETSDLIDMDRVFEDIESETIDLTLDSNNDKIPDYYAKLLYTGELGLSNGSFQFAGRDFESNADYDGDGLLNGEELIVITSGSRVYVQMRSDPTKPDSDFDGLMDKEELDYGATLSGNNAVVRLAAGQEGSTDPLKYTYQRSAVLALTTNDLYLDYLLADEYDSNLALQVSVNLAETMSTPLFVNARPAEAAKQLLIDYFYDYSEKLVENEAEAYAERIAIENANDLEGILVRALQPYSKALVDLNDSKGKIIDAILALLEDHEIRQWLENHGIQVSDDVDIANWGQIIQNLEAVPADFADLYSDLIMIIKQIDTTTEHLQQLDDMRKQLDSLLRQFTSIMGQQGNHSQIWQNNFWQNFFALFDEYAKENTSYQIHLKIDNAFGDDSAFAKLGLVAVGCNTANDMWETVQTYSKLNANAAAYSQNIDILRYLAENDSRMAVRWAASEICQFVDGAYAEYTLQFLTALASDVAQNIGGYLFGNGVKDFLSTKTTQMVTNSTLTKEAATAMVGEGCLYVFLIRASYEIYDLLFGVAERAKSIKKAIYLKSLTRGVLALTDAELQEKQFGFDCRSNDCSLSRRYLTHLANLRIVGEDNFVSYSEGKGWITRQLKSFKEAHQKAEDFCKVTIGRVFDVSSILSIQLSEKLEDLDLVKAYRK